MRVAWVTYEFGEYCIAQANALAAEHDVLLALAASALAECRTLVDERVETYAFERPRLRQVWRQVVSIRALLRRIRRFEPDVLHFQHGHLWFNLALPLLRDLPLVVTIHDPQHHPGDAESRRTPQAVMDFGFRRADCVIVHGESLVDVVHDRIGIPRERIHVVPHVALGDIEGEAPADADDGSVLFFGRIWEYKGLEYLIRAEPLISARIPGVKIVIAGRGEDMERYLRLMAHPDRFVVRNSWIDDDERSELFRRAAVVVLPYVSASQSGVVPLAYAHGKAVVATAVGALPEWVDHGRTGLLVPPRDEAALAEAVVSLLQDRATRKEMGAAGRRWLQLECAPGVVARRTADVYELAVRSAAGRRQGRRTPGGDRAATGGMDGV